MGKEKKIVTMSELLERFQKIGDPITRAKSAYDLGSRVRNFAGELAYSLDNKKDPYGAMAVAYPEVGRKGQAAIKAMLDFAKAVFDTEKFIDVTPRVRGGLGEESQPKLNKYDPGSLLGWVVFLLKKYNLDDAADEVRNVSKSVAKAWEGRNQ